MVGAADVLSNLTPTLVGTYEIVSGVALLLLATVVLRAGFSKRVNQIFFLYLFLWGGFAVVYGLSKSTGDLWTALYLSYVRVHFELPFLAVMIGLAAIYPRPTRFAHSAWFWGALAGITVALEAWYLVDHGWFFSGIGPSEATGTYGTDHADGAHVFYAAQLLVQLGLIFHFGRAYFRPTSEISRNQAKYVLAGALAKSSFNFGFGMGILPLFIARGYLFSSPGAILQGAMALGGVVVGGGLLWFLRRPGRRGIASRDVLIIGGVFAAGVGSGILDALLFKFSVAPNPYYISSAPLWRLLSALFFAYAILRYELLDIDVRLRRWLARSFQIGGGTVVFASMALGFLLVVGQSRSGVVASQVLAALTVLASLKTLERAGSNLAAHIFPGDLESPDYLLERKLSIYRAALESALDGRESLRPTDRQVLERLRRDLGLTYREHTILEYGVRHAQRRATNLVTDSELEPGAILLGKYRIEGFLGEGSYGRTYLATGLTDNMPVALKHFRSNDLAGAAIRVLREAKNLAAVRHPNVIGLLDVDETNRDIFLAMEYADAGSLKDRLERQGALSLSEAVGVLEDVLSGLESVHEHGLIHRDVKPANILLTNEGRAKVADFGLAAPAASADSTLGGFASATGPMGTPAYMSPEQARGLPGDRRSDLYAVAAIFYETLAGRTYLDFRGKTEFEMRAMVLTEKPVLSIDGAPAWVERFLRIGLAKDPAHRFQTAAEMRAELSSSETQPPPPA